MTLIMRKLFLLICIAASVITGNSQNYADYPLYPVPEKYRLKGGAGLPYKVDNSQKKYFPPVINQYGYSCNQASSIGYVFTYEMNRIRNISAEGLDNLYTPGFVWNMLNSSNGGIGVSYFDSWEIVKAAGCPNFLDYPYYMTDTGIWMSGYGKYYRAMKNRISMNYSLPTGNPEDLLVLKQYLDNHFEDSPDGGVASIQIASDGMQTKNWTDPETNEVWPVLWTFGTNIGHALTVIGYNDSVRVDLNNDKKFTNDLDITADGVVDMNDWEIGALLIINSWGDFWKHGQSYLLYSVVARDGNKGGIWNRSVHVPEVVKTYQPELTMRVVMRHTMRRKISIQAGFSTDTTAMKPEQTMSFPVFNHQGDNTPMVDLENASDNARFEFGLDITTLLRYIEPGVPVKFFLIVEETDAAGSATGQVDEFSVINYTTSANEVISKQKNYPLVNNGITYLSLVETLNFNKLKVEKPAVTSVILGQPFYAQLSASGGQPPYRWELVKDYEEKNFSQPFEGISGDTLSENVHRVAFQRVTLPFEFPFYGTKYKSLVADIKGMLSFNNEYIDYPYVVNPDLVFRVRKSIVPFGADIKANMPGEVLLYKGTDSVATFEWRASVYTGKIVYPVNFSAKLYPDGRIKFLYGKRSVPPTDYPWKVGISNGDQLMYKYAAINQGHMMSEDYAITYSPMEYPENLTLTNDGTLSGLISEKDQLWTILVKVIDANNQEQQASIPISSFTRDTAQIQSKNYPNPFRRTTGISFLITEESPVTLEIYDFSGRKVMELVDKTLLPGEFTYFWNARDRSNRDVNPGTYLYRLTIGTRKETGKMVLVR
jgi:hypothetical protein